MNWKLDNHGFRDYFDSIYLTADYGLLKEDVEIYSLILKKENLKAKDCLFTDDLIEHKIPAQKVGIETHLFATADGFRKFLEEKSIL